MGSITTESNISPLVSMTGMQQLSLNDNAIENIDALKDMLDIEHLFLSNNKIESIDSLRRLHSLKVLSDLKTTA